MYGCFEGVLTLADWSAIAQIVLATTALSALVVAVAQIFVTRSSSRQELTYNYTHRFSSPELLPYHEKTGELFKAADSSADNRYQDFLAMGRADQLAALVVPNLFEEMAGMYNQGLLDKGIAKEFFGDAAKEVWNSGAWLIDRWRATDPTYFKQWQLMLENMDLI